jgi:hypothetical protein
VGKTTQLGALSSVLLTIYHSGNQIKEELSEACNTCGGGEVHMGF